MTRKLTKRSRATGLLYETPEEWNKDAICFIKNNKIIPFFDPLVESSHFFPDNWMAQVRAGWVSDATFLEEYFRRNFEQDQPHDLMAYLKADSRHARHLAAVGRYREQYGVTAHA